MNETNNAAAAIPADKRDIVEFHAKGRAEQLQLDWSTLSEAHKQGIRETIWSEMMWRD